MPFDPRAVANEFLKLAKTDGKQLDPMKLQKLIYFAHGWNLALNNRPLLDRPVQAWRYGPVIPDVYQCFRRFGSSPITEPARASAISGSKIQFPAYRITASEGADGEAETAQKTIRRVWETYKRYSAIALSELTHRDGGAWEKSWKRWQGQKFIDMREDEIKEEFCDKLKRSESGV